MANIGEQSIRMTSYLVSRNGAVQCSRCSEEKARHYARERLGWDLWFSAMGDRFHGLGLYTVDTWTYDPITREGMCARGKPLTHDEAIMPFPLVASTVLERVAQASA